MKLARSVVRVRFALCASLLLAATHADAAGPPASLEPLPPAARNDAAQPLPPPAENGEAPSEEPLPPAPLDDAAPSADPLPPSPRHQGAPSVDASPPPPDPRPPSDDRTQPRDASPPSPGPPHTPEADLPELSPGEFRVPKTRVVLQFAASARLDVIYDINGMGSKDAFVPWTIPLDGTARPNLFLDPRKSRFGLAIRYENAIDLALVLECDFMSASNTLRIRKAYAQIWRFVIGQDWSAFTNPTWIPPTLDFENPISYVTQRSPLIRYTQPLGIDGFDLAVSAEYLVANVSDEVTTEVPGTVVTLAPELVAALQYETQRIHASLHALVRNLFYEPDGGERSHYTGWAINAILGYAIAGRHRIYAQGILGDAVGAYRGLPDLVLDDDGNVTKSRGFGGTLGGQFQLYRDKVFTNIVGSFLQGALPGQDDGGTNYSVYAAANLEYRPLRFASFGIEYLFGQYGSYDGPSGYNNRIQATVRVSLP